MFFLVCVEDTISGTTSSLYKFNYLSITFVLFHVSPYAPSYASALYKTTNKDDLSLMIDAY